MTKTSSASYGHWSNTLDEHTDWAVQPKLIRRLYAHSRASYGGVEWNPYRRLARAILIQAWRDSLKESKEGEKAREFLNTPNEDLEFWRTVGEI